MEIILLIIVLIAAAFLLMHITIELNSLSKTVKNIEEEIQKNYGSE